MKCNSIMRMLNIDKYTNFKFILAYNKQRTLQD